MRISAFKTQENGIQVFGAEKLVFLLRSCVVETRPGNHEQRTERIKFVLARFLVQKITLREAATTGLQGGIELQWPPLKPDNESLGNRSTLPDASL